LPSRRGSAPCRRQRSSADNLLTFPWIKDAVDAGHITLHGCFFDIRSGILERLGGDGVFRPISD